MPAATISQGSIGFSAAHLGDRAVVQPAVLPMTGSVAAFRYLSVCSGIEAATAAWHPLGWSPVAFSEIEAFPRAVLAHHYPTVPLHGDFTTIGADDYGPIDLLVGGTPCQSFSIAGLRGGLADDRGNLALEFLRLADRKRPRWVVWENVPGVLSSNGGRDFGSILGGLVELGYGFAYRVLDAQHFGVPQRRRRVFVVGYLGDWRRPAAVLFERHSLSGHPAPRRETRERTAGRPDDGPIGSLCADSHPGAYSGQDAYTGRLIAHALRGEGFDASEDGTRRGTPLIADTLTSNGDAHSGYRDEKGLVVAIQERAVSENIDAGPQGKGWRDDDTAYTLEARQTGQAVAFDTYNQSVDVIGQTLQRGTGSDQIGSVFAGSAVRRLTPRECERLQGFPDDFTLVPYRGKPASDGPRYKALGNSMAVPCMRWIGERIELVRSIHPREVA